VPSTVMHALVRAEQSPFIGELIEDLLEYIEGQP
jgi:hypothetical protein